MQLVKTLLLSLLWMVDLAANSQAVRLSGRGLSLPPGEVIGATFSRSGDQFVVQQVVSSADSSGRYHFSRFVSTWSAGTMSPLVARDLGEDPGNSAACCGRVVSVDRHGWVLICSARSSLEVLNSTTLATERTIAVGRYIYDFAVDEDRDRIYVLYYGDDGSVRLASYSLSGFAQQAETIVVSTPVLVMEILIEPKSGQLIVAETYEKAYWYTRVYLCSLSPGLSCPLLSQVAPINQTVLLGRELLYVGGDPLVTNKKRDCVNALNLDTKSTTREYCSPDTGVRFAVGVAGGQYVIGFTGTTKHLIIEEQLVLRKSSLAIWNVEDRRVAAVVNDADIGGPRHYIVASGAKPEFLLYNGQIATLFTISEGQ